MADKHDKALLEILIRAVNFPSHRRQNQNVNVNA